MPFINLMKFSRLNVNNLKLGQNNVYDNPDLLKKLYNFKYISLNNFDNLL